MKGTLLIAATLTLVSAEVGHAATLFTPMARAESGSTLGCRAVNVTRKPLAISIKRGDLNGVDSQSDCPNVAPGAACPLLTPGPIIGYCRFDVEGGKKTIRAALTVEDSGGTHLLIEAR